MTDILIFDRHAQRYQDILSAALPDARLWTFHESGEAGLEERAAQSTIWLASAERASRLLAAGVKPPQWLQSTSAGVEPLFAPGLAHPQRASRAVDVFGQAMTEYVLTYVLAWRRQVFAWAGAQRRSDWDGPEPAGLAGLKVLIAGGAGVIGQDMARLLAPFGVVLRGVASRARAVPGFEHVYGTDDLLEAAAWADVVVNVLPDTPGTQDLFDARFFAALPAGALFINAGRGKAVVDLALVQALESGHLGAAAIDVCRDEPPPAAHPFWLAPRLWLTGHTAAPTVPEPLAQLFLDNLARWRAGQPLRGELDFTRGY